MGHGIANEFEILREGNTERIGDVQRPAFPEERDDRGLCLQQRFDIGVALYRITGFSGGPERDDRRRLQRNRLDHPKELNVLGIRAGPASFDELHAQSIQLLCNPDLVFYRKTDILSLSPIA